MIGPSTIAVPSLVSSSGGSRQEECWDINRGILVVVVLFCLCPGPSHFIVVTRGPVRSVPSDCGTIACAPVEWRVGTSAISSGPYSPQTCISHDAEWAPLGRTSLHDTVVVVVDDKPLHHCRPHTLGDLTILVGSHPVISKRVSLNGCHLLGA